MYTNVSPQELLAVISYSGPERRIHQVFVTRNTEYHLRSLTCVGVRDRHSGQWLSDHFALHRTIAGTLRVSEGGAISANPGLPQIGESIYFEALGRDLVTSLVISVERPRPEIVAQYS
jgi:hypothetical protein